MRKKLLIIGPFPGPPKGISLSNQVVANGFSKKNWHVSQINTEVSDAVNSSIGQFSIDKLSFLKTYLQLYKIWSAQVVYITIGITFFGVLKYAPFIFLAKILQKKLVVHVHSNHLKKEYSSLKGFKKKLFFKILASFDAGIVLSKSLRDNLTPFIANESVYEVYNFVEDQLVVSEQLLHERKDFSKVKLFFLSNLLEEKGINILLKVLQRFQNEGLSLEVRIAGNTIEGNNLDDLFLSLDSVSYLGTVTGTAKQDLLIWGNVFCLPTFFSMEGQPISILEAMAFNAFIVTTKHAGIPDICSDLNAVFCNEKSEDDLYKQLKYTIDNWDQLQKKAIANGVFARETFTETRFINTIEEIILETLIR
jgi:glycosyltransferase involved in cell wall biosynthesis